MRKCACVRAGERCCKTMSFFRVSECVRMCVFVCAYVIRVCMCVCVCVCLRLYVYLCVSWREKEKESAS